MLNKFLKFTFLFILLVSFGMAFASETNGTVDSTYKYAWGENLGWLNFGCTECDVAITDTAITGYAWSRQFGWINLAPANSGVTNTAEGTLSGSAWGSNVGWIDFDGVTINASGEFLGYATVDSDSSQINFNCTNGSSCASADFKVKTDWRPASVRVVADTGGSNNSGSIPRPSATESPTENPVVSVIEDIADFIVDLFKPTTKPTQVVEVPIVPPPSLAFRWNLLPAEAIRAFVFAPLPYEIRILAGKFPELEKTLNEVGITRLSDLNKLTGVDLNIPGLADILSRTIKSVGLEDIIDIESIKSIGLNVPGFSDDNLITPGDLGVGKIALIEGIPVAKFSPSIKKNLPSEFVFARAGGELVDLKVALSVTERGLVTQTISSLPGKFLRLVVKPISRASSVTGYIVFQSATPKVSQDSTNSISRASLTASALFSMEGLVENVSTTLPKAEQKLVLSTFEYLDPDKDGIYTADVLTPSVPGEYEIITIIDYIDPVLGSRKMSLITVIDPEGYVFEKNDGKETRIPSATVSLYKQNTTTKKYELWNAKDYIQDNPQITDVRGTYSFLVPAGSYYFHVEAPGYEVYEGEPFVVAEGNGIHQNIELKSGGWVKNINWQTLLLIVVLILLVYNLYRNRLRDRLLNLSNQNV